MNNSHNITSLHPLKNQTITTRWGPQSIAKLPCRKVALFMVDITNVRIHGGYYFMFFLNQRPYLGNAPSKSMKFPETFSISQAFPK